MHVNFIKQARDGIRKLVPYEPGKPVDEVARELGLNSSDIIKLASNENPLGSSPHVLDALDATRNILSRYPDGNAFEAKQALASHLDVPSEQITLGNGSDELLRLVAMAWSGPGDEIIFSRYAFAVYPIATLSAGATPVEIPDKKWGHDLTAKASAITEKTRIIFIANPNNPTGTWLSSQEIRSFLQTVPPHVLVVLDEAYVEYIEETRVTESPSWITGHPNLIITRTFSKAYGLAGLRMGYAIASPEVTDILNRIRPAFNSGTIAQQAVQAALEDQDFVERSRQMNKEGLQQFEQAFQGMGLEYIPSRANFITVNTGLDGQKVFKQLLAKGIIVRPLTGYKMPSHLRISVGLPEENEACIKTLELLLRS